MSEYSDGLASVRLHLVDSVQKAQEFLAWAGERRPFDGAVSVDIETGERFGRDTKDALNPWLGDIRLVQVGDGEQGWAIPWDEWKGVFYAWAKHNTSPVVCHNIAFEAKWFAVKSHWQFPWHLAHDTMIMAHLVNPLGSGALKRLAAQHVDGRAVALQDTLHNKFSENGWTWGTVPIDFEPYWSYGALDTVLTMRLYEHFYPKVRPGSGYAIPYELEMATRRIATRMEVNGARVDLEYSQRKHDELIQYSQSVKEWVKTNYGASITSNVQMVRVFEGLGAEITEVTPSGQKSMTKDQLAMFIRDGSAPVKMLADVMLKQRQNDKLASSYFSNFLNDNIGGFVHPSIRTLGARTGRMSITDPALQTLPSGDPTVRRAFLPKDDDHRIISSDLDQVEFRITAGLSGDVALIKLFHEADATGGDVFTQIMRQVYDDPTLDKDRDKDKRKLIKGVVYGKLYGAGPEKMALTAGVSVAQMKAVVDAFDASYPGVKGLQKQIEDVGMRRLKGEGQGYVMTRTGRRLPCDDDRVYSLTNYLVQSSAAEIFKQNLVKLDQADLVEHMIVPVHDEIVLQAHVNDVEEIKQTVKECMTTTDGWPVALTSGVDGPFTNWGQAYEKK